MLRHIETGARHELEQPRNVWCRGPERCPAVEEMVELACRAPSVHNTQPWRWRARESTVDLFADYTRQLVYADPTRRDLMISCGAALHHLQVAAAGLGWAARVTRFPDPSEERHVATIALEPSG